MLKNLLPLPLYDALKNNLVDIFILLVVGILFYYFINFSSKVVAYNNREGFGIGGGGGGVDSVSVGGSTGGKPNPPEKQRDYIDNAIDKLDEKLKQLDDKYKDLEKTMDRKTYEKYTKLLDKVMKVKDYSGYILIDTIAKMNANQLSDLLINPKNASGFGLQLEELGEKHIKSYFITDIIYNSINKYNSVLSAKKE